MPPSTSAISRPATTTCPRCRRNGPNCSSRRLGPPCAVHDGGRRDGRRRPCGARSGWHGRAAAGRTCRGPEGPPLGGQGRNLGLQDARLIDADADGVCELPVTGAVPLPAAVLIRPDGHVDGRHRPREPVRCARSLARPPGAPRVLTRAAHKNGAPRVCGGAPCRLRRLVRGRAPGCRVPSWCDNAPWGGTGTKAVRRSLIHP